MKTLIDYSNFINGYSPSKDAIQGTVNPVRDLPRSGMFDRLPNVRTFAVKTQDYDLRYLRANILRRESPIITSTPAQLARANRYIDWMEHRLVKARDAKNATLYWITMSYILNRSNTFMFSGLHHCERKWYTDIPVRKLGVHLQEYKNIGLHRSTDINLRRVYIPKPNGSLRPLGVPSLGWRMYLHLLNQGMVLFLIKNVPTFQHGYIPNRGVLTAWASVYKTILPQPTIVEFDVKGFFDNVSLKSISDTLKHYQVPLNIITLYRDLNLSTPQLATTESSFDESATIAKKLLVRTHKERSVHVPHSTAINADSYGIYAHNSYLTHPTKAQVKAFLSENPTHFGSVPLTTQSDHARRIQEYPSHNWSPSIIYDDTLRGVAQGAPTSPFIAGLVLAHAFAKSGLDMTQTLYADDGLIGSATLSGSELLSHTSSILATIGCTLSDKPTQVRVLKENGIWTECPETGLLGFKFLGMRYDPDLHELRSETRRGVCMMFTNHLLLKELGIDLTHITEEQYEALPNFIEESYNSGIKSFLVQRLDNWIEEQNGNRDNFKGPTLGPFRSHYSPEGWGFVRLMQDLHKSSYDWGYKPISDIASGHSHADILQADKAYGACSDYDEWIYHSVRGFIFNTMYTGNEDNLPVGSPANRALNWKSGTLMEALHEAGISDKSININTASSINFGWLSKNIMQLIYFKHKTSGPNWYRKGKFLNALGTGRFYLDKTGKAKRLSWACHLPPRDSAWQDRATELLSIGKAEHGNA